MLVFNFKIRDLRFSDCKTIPQAFALQGWEKAESLYLQYLKWQESGVRDVLIGCVNNTFSGYLTISWQANYLPFRRQNIPEIVDFNVLKKFQRQGIGTALMDEAERRIGLRAKVAGLGVGVHKDYGPAHILYVKRGYIPDGNGLTLDSKPLEYDDQVTIDHSLTFAMTKQV